MPTVLLNIGTLLPESSSIESTMSWTSSWQSIITSMAHNSWPVDPTPSSGSTMSRLDNSSPSSRVEVLANLVTPIVYFASNSIKMIPTSLSQEAGIIMSRYGMWEVQIQWNLSMDHMFAENPWTSTMVTFWPVLTRIVKPCSSGISEHMNLLIQSIGMRVFHQRNLASFMAHNSKRELESLLLQVVVVLMR